MAALFEAELCHAMKRLTLHNDAAKFDIEISGNCDPDKKLSSFSEDSITKIPIAPSDIQIDCQVSVIPKLQHFCRQFDVYADYDDKEAGQALTSYIDRLPLRVLKPRNFHGSLKLLDTQSNGHTFALDLCKRDGTLQSKHMIHPWGKEINHGPVLILILLTVRKEYRRQGIAQMLLNAQIAQAKKQRRGLRFMFVKPGVCPDDIAEQVHDNMSLEETMEVRRRAYAKAVRFYRAYGFRRVGLSNWFCLAMDQEHPSHNIAPEDDPNPAPHTEREMSELYQLMGIQI
ncbi:hypothetical protein BKA64DRAFT_711163 [Cadophora sp. MPI-SDFR-AT-0126]|nr:hypothetical protein BKA64DRAFT_711163 [Leotiomycetes sp. MPI-SDFR-AT-0126]